MDTFSQSVVIDADTIISHDEALVVWLEHQTFMNKGVYNTSDDTKIYKKNQNDRGDAFRQFFPCS